MKRIFISIPIPEELRQDIADFKARFPGLAVRWLAPENLHITLLPPIEVTDAELAQIAEQLKTVPAMQLFPISFHNVSYGTAPHFPRLIWARGDAPTELLQLKQNIEQVMHYQPDRPEFNMHITLARFKEKDFAKLSIRDLDESVHWKMLVSEFVIMQAIRQPSGARYPILQTFVLSK